MRPDAGSRGHVRVEQPASLEVGKAGVKDEGSVSGHRRVRAWRGPAAQYKKEASSSAEGRRFCHQSETKAKSELESNVRTRGTEAGKKA
jgi:hypothetical protein